MTASCTARRRDGCSAALAIHREGIAHVFETEDAPELQRIFSQGYHAVVGNPPYIAVQDGALRDAYRRYASCHGQYVLTVPFMERFFELAIVESPNGALAAGFVGKITGNSFMKREFGAPLVEAFLPSVDLQTLIDTSGAYIPGHGTPTVILFGRNRPPVARTLRVLDGIRGEPRQPSDPARGLVWTSIETIGGHASRSGPIRSCAVVVERSELEQHPMTLGLGRDLRRRAGIGASRPSQMPQPIWRVFGDVECRRRSSILPLALSRRCDADGFSWPLVVGDAVRDWAIRDLGATLLSIRRARPGHRRGR